MIWLVVGGLAIAVSTLSLALVRRSRRRRAKQQRFETAIARHVQGKARQRHHALPEED